MTTSCMQAIKQQLEAMPLEEFENFLKGVTVNKPHEEMPQHAELLSQLKHHVKVQPDEPIQSKASDKECRTFWKSLNQRDSRHQNHQQRLSSSSSSGSSNLNGNLGGIQPHQYIGNSANQLKHPSDYNSVGKTFVSGDQNANPVSSTSDTSSHLPIQNINQGKHRDYNNHHRYHSTLAYGNSLDGDPGGSWRRSHERDARPNDNTSSTKSSTNKNVYSADDEEQEFDGKPDTYTGKLPAQYILPNLTKFNNNSKDLPLPLFQKPTSTAPASNRLLQPIASGSQAGENSVTASSTSWDLHASQNNPVQLNDGYKSVASITSGCNYNDRITPARESTSASSPSSEQTYGTVRSVSPNLPPAASSAMITKSPTIEGSQLDKPTTRRAGDRKKKPSKNVLRETLLIPQEMPGYKGNQDIDQLLEFVEGNQSKAKKPAKDKKRETKPNKSNEKQVLSKAASLDENSLGYGSKKEEAAASRSRTNKDVEKKNSANITKSSTAICTVEGSSTIPVTNELSSNNYEPDTTRAKVTSATLVNGGTPPFLNSKGTSGKVTNSNSGKSSATPKTQTETSIWKAENITKTPDVVAEPKSEVVLSHPVDSKDVKVVGKAEEEKFAKPDEAEGPYVLVQSKKKREKKKTPQRESENFPRAHNDQSRREGGRVRRSNTERRKSVGSVPGSENSECSDDDDSVRSLPAGECTPRERIPKPCSSSGGTPQTSYADIARMSKDETGKSTTTPISPLPSGVKTQAVVKPPPTTTVTTTVAVTVASDTNFPALSPPTSEKTVPVVGAAVWPCRPRFDPDGVLKEKGTPNSKAEEAPSKEGTSTLPPQQSAIHSNISQKCSTKPLVESKESSSQAKNSFDKSNEVNTITASEIPPSKGEVLQQFVSSRTNSCIEIGQSASAKVPVIKKVDDRKAKDKPIKVSNDESLNKANLTKGTENNDSTNQPTEPVVFCGGKFDSSQLPVGQKSGFEFGFGVIEALNDNNNGGNNQSVAKNALSTVLISDGAHDGQQECRSQDCEKEKLTSNKDHVGVKPLDKTHDNKISSLKNRGSSASLMGEVPQVNSEPISSPATPIVSVKTTEVPSTNTHEAIEDGSKTSHKITENQQPKLTKIDVAHLFQPAVCCKVPETVLQAADYMNAYANRLNALSMEGKLSVHRIM